MLGIVLLTGMCLYSINLGLEPKIMIFFAPLPFFLPARQWLEGEGPKTVLDRQDKWQKK